MTDFKITVAMLVLTLLGWAPWCSAQSGHSDVAFRYESGKIAVETSNGMGVATGDFPTSGIFRQFESNPGFASEADAGLGIGAGDLIVYNVLEDLIYWDGTSLVPPTPGTQIRMENNGASEPDTIISRDSGPQPGSFSPSANTLGTASSGGDFHSHIDFFLEPNVAPEPPPPPEIGAYAARLSLSTNASGILDSDPFYFVFNFGLDEEPFEQGVQALAELLETSLVGDYNANGIVDAADYVVWRNSLATPQNLAADGDGDGDVDADDYLVWVENFGNALADDAGSTVWPDNAGARGASTITSRSGVPEPGAAALATMALLATALAHQRPQIVRGRRAARKEVTMT